ncbi:MAG: carbonic anhydrase [Phycisphaerae bacterium]|nr:carbonic anhydrase [Gemmatimonadaceae bacterium]
MQKLIKGLHAFQRDVFTTQRELFERLAGGQTPDALFITCSDSRINPNLITQTEPGDLFILRNAGNIVPPYGPSGGGEAATVEFAVAALGVKDIIVCGHSHCGAVKGMLDESLVADTPAVKSWLEHAEITKRVMRENYGELQGDRLLSACVQENVLAQLDNLKTHPSVAARLTSGRINLHAWVYTFETGQVFAYDPSHGQFVPFQEAPLESLRADRGRMLVAI